MSGISFKNNKAIKSRERLRQFFPLNDGDTFSREKIAAGLANLRNAYGQIGYVNFTSVPDTSFDEENKSISLAVDGDEGKQFHVGAIDVLGVEDPARERFIESLPIRPGRSIAARFGNKLSGCKDRYFPVIAPIASKND